MPIDASIPLHIAPLPDPLEAMGRMAQLRQYGQQRQLNNLEIQARQQQNQEREQALADERAWREALRAEMDGPPGGITAPPAQATSGTAATLRIPAAPAPQPQAQARAQQPQPQPVVMGNVYERALQRAVRSGAISPKAISSIQTMIDADRQKHLAMQKAEFENMLAQHNQVRGLLQSVIQAKPEDRQRVYSRVVAQGVARGLLQPGTYPETVPDEATLQAWDLEMAGGEQAAKENIERRRASAQEQQAQIQRERWAAERPGVTAQADQRVRQNAGALLSAAQSQDQWNQALASLPENQRGVYSPMYSPAEAGRASDLALTPEQRAQAQATQQRDAETRAYHNAMISQGWARINDQRAKEGADGLTPNARGIQNRAIAKQVSDLEKQEDQLHAQRNALGPAVATGAVYVDRNGKIVPMSTASGGDEQAKAALIEEMRRRFATATDQLKRVIPKKNELVVKGGGRLGESTDQAMQRLDRGSQMVSPDTPQPASESQPTRAASPIPKKSATKGAPAAGSRVITMRLPDGNFVTGTQEQLDAFMKKAGLRAKQ